MKRNEHVCVCVLGKLSPTNEKKNKRKKSKKRNIWP